jgi:hypothetical protein
MIRGEYWIVDSDVWYADGTYGDTDHRTHALQYCSAANCGVSVDPQRW